MTLSFWRTNNTDLSDDELILMDAMFDGDIALEMLQRDSFAELHNLTYVHSLSDTQLHMTINSLLERDLLRHFYYVYEPDTTYYGLTAAGGSLWEAERQPDWQHYYYTTISQQPDSRWMWSVESPSLSSAKQYYAIAREYADHPVGVSAVQPIEKPHYRFLPWKIFSVIYELSSAIPDAPALPASRLKPLWQSVTDLIDIKQHT